MIFERRTYLKQLLDGSRNDMVKIVTGIRRCGKSFLLFNLFRTYLLEHGTDERHIICLSLDDRKNRRLLDPDVLLDYIDELNPDDGQTTYVILDEVQLVEDFVGVMLSLMHMRNVQAYVSGSNSRFLSTDVVTEFRGRGWEIRVHPLSFAEVYEAKGGDMSQLLMEYYRYGGLPQVVLMESNEEKEAYLKGLCETIYLRDVVEHNHLRNPEGMRTLLQVLASAIGSSTNGKRIADTFASELNVKITQPTVVEYLRHLEDAFIIAEAQRYDVKGRKYIGTQNKYYFEDLGVRNALLNFRQVEETHAMENVLYNELRRRRYSVDVGVVETMKRNGEGRQQRVQLEVDFVLNKASVRIYVQSALAMPDREKEQQEQASLLNINDAFKKVIIVGGYYIPHYNENGVLITGLFDFLMDENGLEVRG